MTASAATLPKKHRTWDLSDLLSPVAVKEMRQIVRSGFVRAAFLALLAIQVMAMGLFLMTDQLNIGSSASSFGRGADLFIILQIILVAVSLLFVPAYTGVRMAMEYSVEHVDLMFIAGMHPWAIMTGKLTAAVALTSILYAACMPFMLLTYLLRGVDIPTILTVLTASYLTTIWATAAILLSNCIRLSRAGRMGIGIALLVGLMIAAGINIAVAYYMVDEGQGMETGNLTAGTANSQTGNRYFL